MAALSNQLHITSIGHHTLHLLQVNQERPMAAYDHGIGTQLVLHLFRGGTQHIIMHLPITQVVHLNIITYSLDVKQIRSLQRQCLSRRSCEDYLAIALNLWRRYGCQTFQLFIKLTRLLQFCGQMTATELKTPVQADGKEQKAMMTSVWR